MIILGQNWLFLILWILQYVAVSVGLFFVFKKTNSNRIVAFIPIYHYFPLFKLCWKRRYFWIALVFAVFLILLDFYDDSYITTSSYIHLLSTMYDGTLTSILSILLFGPFVSVMYIAFLICYYVFHIKLMIKINKSFSHDWPFALGLIFFPYIFLIILGFDKSKYIGNYSEIKKENKKHGAALQNDERISHVNTTTNWIPKTALQPESAVSKSANNSVATTTTRAQRSAMVRKRR